MFFTQILPSFANCCIENPVNLVKQGTIHFSLGVAIRYISTRSFNSALMGGAGFATAEIVHILATPLFGKISNPDIKKTAKDFTRCFIVTSIYSANPGFGLTIASIVVVSKISSLLLCKIFKSLNVKDCDSFLKTSIFTILFTDNVILGLTQGSLVFVARVICTYTYPYFKAQIEKSATFKKYAKDFPEEWGVSCAKMYVAQLISLSSFTTIPVSMATAAIHPVITNCAYLYLKWVQNNNFVSAGFKDKNINDMYEKVFQEKLDQGFFIKTANDAINIILKLFNHVVLDF
jgi:hypothetical protein